MKFTNVLLAFAALAAVSQSSLAQQATSTAPAPAPGTRARTAPAPAPAAAARRTPPAPPAIKYAPTRSFKQWVRDLPHDPAILIGFIFSLASGIGFLFIIYAVLFELVMGIPYKKQSYVLGGSPVNSVNNPVAAVN